MWYILESNVMGNDDKQTKKGIKLNIFYNKKQTLTLKLS